jgi:23S rRNA (adenine2503-C2)-methyltransferase
MLEKLESHKNLKTIKGLTLDELREYFLSTGEPQYRAEQVFKWLYGDLVDDFDEMKL